jgi:hypothetical protein
MVALDQLAAGIMVAPPQPPHQKSIRQIHDRPPFTGLDAETHAGVRMVERMRGLKGRNRRKRP